MALSADDLSEIGALLGAPEADPQIVAELRRRFPKLSLTRCDASDMADETAFREYPLFDLYLVDGMEHCWKLTSDPARATGLVVVPHKLAA
ncbi:hypothetical protein HNR60_002784 [Rhodopseudomonas rhenobacensis]|uniref:Uncharacterized protein n=1 Tax=Rhodopseudomonas rhenobacensis TaxID=87461 RepID=A0A7W7Z4T9_9BRAD|nr:hypothetical protein [Rhodopseudomonas rhenobacensis]MBB5048025.1 hypothetical protein [Rhodopseudomonas rhenobacensis]